MAPNTVARSQQQRRRATSVVTGGCVHHPNITFVLRDIHHPRVRHELTAHNLNPLCSWSCHQATIRHTANYPVQHLAHPASCILHFDLTTYRDRHSETHHTSFQATRPDISKDSVPTFWSVQSRHTFHTAGEQRTFVLGRLFQARLGRNDRKRGLCLCLCPKLSASEASENDTACTSLLPLGKTGADTREHNRT